MTIISPQKLRPTLYEMLLTSKRYIYKKHILLLLLVVNPSLAKVVLSHCARVYVVVSLQNNLGASSEAYESLFQHDDINRTALSR